MIAIIKRPFHLGHVLHFDIDLYQNGGHVLNEMVVL